ncbi:MAG: RagB/SusD family nutrient uptake outer membrane protein, partial [Bacteroidota bacterium]
MNAPRNCVSRILSGAIAAALLLPLTACDDVLVKPPLGELTSESFFETPDHALQATNATYAQLRDWQVHVFSWLGMTDIVSDDATKGSTPGDAPFLLSLENLDFDPGNIAFRDTWQGYYRGIYRANLAIENIPGIDMDPALRSRLVGENQFLRAYYYFFLVRAFGGVPLITEPLSPDEYQQERAPEDAVFALIEQD